MLPVAAATLTSAEWDRFRSAGRSGRISSVPLIIGMLRYEADLGHFTAMMSEVPAPIRTRMLKAASWAFPRHARAGVRDRDTSPDHGVVLRSQDQCQHGGPAVGGLATSTSRHHVEGSRGRQRS